MTCASQTDIGGFSDEEALNIIGHLIDQARDHKNASATTHAFTLLDQLAERELVPEHQATAHYFRANAWANRTQESGDVQSWAWEQLERQNEILELRRAVSHCGFGKLDKLRQCQILTNLANNQDAVGRFIEAIATWDRAITIDERFGMAHGNRGNGLCCFANALYDGGHSGIIWLAAIDAFETASQKETHFDNEQNEPYRRYFASLRDEAAKNIDLDFVRGVYEKGNKKTRLGRSKIEQKYRNWALRNRLFLNPLNDLGENAIASHDVFTLPSIMVAPDSPPSARPPPIIGMYNQMKQEFISARFMFFEGMSAERPHFSDKGVIIYNTFDYSSHSLAVEKIRTAYRLAYSLFDKIAYFLNHYLDLGHPDNKVNFRNVWCERKGANPKTLLPLFWDRPNWPLRGLFWLSKDLFEPDFKQVMEPEAEELADIRHCLEHKFFQLHESWAVAGADPEDWQPDVGFHIGRDEFLEKTLHVLKLARAALMYLSLAVFREEQIRYPDASEELIIPLPLDTLEDEWKT